MWGGTLKRWGSIARFKLNQERRRTPVKHYIERTALAAVSIAVLYMNLVPAAQADDACSTAKAAGDWGGTLTGTLILPTGPVPGAAVGRLSIDEAGNVTGTEARNVGGGFANETLTGMWAVNPDCTGTLTVNVYESGQLTRTSVLSIVFIDKLREARLVQQSLTLPDGTAVPVVITVDFKRLFPNKGNEH
jgi:hypothetical protein